MRIFLLSTLCVGLILGKAPLAAERSEPLLKLKSSLESWVKLEDSRSKEREEGEIQRQHLQVLVEVLESQLAQHKSQVEAMEGKLSRSDRERELWLQKRDRLALERERASKTLKLLERRVMGLLPLVPVPLEKELGVPLKLLAKAEKNDEQWLGRYRALLAVMKGLSAFHRRYSQGSHTVELSSPGPISAKVIYMGLSKAYFLGLDGETCGVGKPSPGGWQWEVEPQLRDSITTALDVFEGQTLDLSLVSLPLELSK